MDSSNENSEHADNYQAEEKDVGASSGSKVKKGLWEKYTERLKDTKCSRTSQDCE